MFDPVWLAAPAVLLPVLAAVVALVFDRAAPAIGIAASAGAGAAGLGLLLEVARGGAWRHEVAGWRAPLGLALEADGFSALLLAMTGTVGLLVALQARRTLVSARPPAAQDRAAPWAFWPLWLLLLGGLNALYLSADQFNIYVTLELVSLSAVGLTALTGTPAALRAAMRYLLVGLLASLLYLGGVALLYAESGVLDIGGARALLEPGPASQLAMAAMIAGLALKTALFPLHFWLPPAHGNAAAPVSALLSALVVKASFCLVVRLWFDLWAPAGLATPDAAQLLGALGAGAVLWGSVQALLAERLKLLVAYSTVAQIGYLFLLFPLDGFARGEAFAGAAVLALAHGFSKAAMFLSCELVANRLGHDRIADLTSSRKLPRITQVTIGLAAVSLIGLPPSGGFLGKWLLLVASLREGPGVWSAVLVAGTLLSAAAMFRVLVRFFAAQPDGAEAAQVHARPTLAARVVDLVPLVLALAALALGFAGTPLLAVLRITGGGA